MLHRRSLVTGALGALFAAPGAARAQGSGGRTIRLIVPFPPGGGTDILARLFAERAAPRLDATFVVENRAGGGGSIGSDTVAKAAPDGATLVLGTSSSHAIVAALNPQLPHDVVRDFTPVAMVARAPFVLVVHPSVAATDVAALVALARANPGRLNYASSGNGTTPHLAAELFKTMTATDILHVPYRGSPAAIPDLLAGRVQMMFDSPTTAIPHIRSGALRALAVTGSARVPALPEVPTMQEAGVRDYEALGWFALFGPAGLAPDVTARLNAAFDEVAGMPDVRERMAQLGVEPAPMPPLALGAFQRAEVEKWGAIVRSAGIKAD